MIYQWKANRVKSDKWNKPRNPLECANECQVMKALAFEETAVRTRRVGGEVWNK